MVRPPPLARLRYALIVKEDGLRCFYCEEEELADGLDSCRQRERGCCVTGCSIYAAHTWQTYTSSRSAGEISELPRTTPLKVKLFSCVTDNSFKLSKTNRRVDACGSVRTSDGAGVEEPIHLSGP